jgi:hypothetical protein
VPAHFFYINPFQYRISLFKNELRLIFHMLKLLLLVCFPRYLLWKNLQQYVVKKFEKTKNNFLGMLLQISQKCAQKSVRKCSISQYIFWNHFSFTLFFSRALGFKLGVYIQGSEWQTKTDFEERCCSRGEYRMCGEYDCLRRVGIHKHYNNSRQFSSYTIDRFWGDVGGIYVRYTTVYAEEAFINISSMLTTLQL